MSEHVDIILPIMFGFDPNLNYQVVNEGSSPFARINAPQ
jgi:hypothetical protein